MTIEALGTKPRRRATTSDSLPIGETDSNIFDCPACARPLSSGASRCPGCGTRLIAGVQAGRALSFVALGLVLGLVVGGGGAAAAMTASRVQDPAIAAPLTPAAATSVPLSTAAAVAPGAVAMPDPAIPGAAISGLRQAALVNQRVATDAGRLLTVLAAAQPAPGDLARILRSMSSNAMVGERIARDLSSWGAGAVLAAELGGFYAAIRATAGEGLAASLRNERAYLAAADAMLLVVDGLGALDGRARTLASTAAVDLPAIILPEAAGPTESAAVPAP